MDTVHFVTKFRNEQTICGAWVISIFDIPDTYVYNVRWLPEVPENCTPCQDCLDRLPLLDLAETEL